MAAKYAYLRDGPCDGTRHKLTQGDINLDSVLCKGGLYVGVVPAKYHDGDRIFEYGGKAPVVKPPDNLSAPHALGGWHALRKSVNRGLPDAISYSQQHTKAALRELSRARKVRL